MSNTRARDVGFRALLPSGSSAFLPRMVRAKAPKGGGLRDPRKAAGKGAKQRREHRRAQKFRREPEAPAGSEPTASTARKRKASSHRGSSPRKHARPTDSAPPPAVARKHGTEVSDSLAKACCRWEKLRDSSAEPSVRQHAAEEVASLVREKCVKLALNHKGSRILQALLKHGSSAHWRAVADELEPHLPEISQSKYGSFLASKLFRTAKGTRFKKLLKALRGSVPRLARHEHASRVLTVAFAAANGRERSQMAAEFYGKEFLLFGIGGVKGETRESDGKVALPLQRGHSHRGEIIQALARNLIPILEKGLLGNELVHPVLLDYLQYAGDGAVNDAALSVSAVAVLQMLHSREGVECASILFLAMSSKERKSVLKSMRESVVDMARDKHAHAFLMCVLDAADDTIAVTNNVLMPLSQSLLQLMRSSYGRRPLLHLISYRSRRHFPPQTQHTLPKRESDSCGLSTPSTSKKDPHLRRLELLGPSGGLAAQLVRTCEQYARTLLCSRMGSDVLCEVALGGSGNVIAECVAEHELRRLMEATAVTAPKPKIVNADEENETIAQESEDEAVMQSFFGSRALRRLARASTHVVDAMYTHALKGRVGEWARTHGAKVVAACASKEGSESASAVKEELAESMQSKQLADEWLRNFMMAQAANGQ